MEGLRTGIWKIEGSKETWIMERRQMNGMKLERWRKDGRLGKGIWQKEGHEETGIMER
jgi:hypothetical protein